MTPPPICSGSATAPVSPTARTLNSAAVSKNPIGIKCGPSLEPDDLLRLVDILNPKNEAGRIVLIARFGAGNVEAGLPKLVQKIQAEGRQVVWSCDPMHGNTIKAGSGYKTRKFDDVLAEVKAFFDVCPQRRGVSGRRAFRDDRSKTSPNVLGGVQEISEADLSSRYHTHCDPRLNASQALELAFIIADRFKETREKSSAGLL